MKLISTLRAELMGLAIGWIMLYHMGIKLPHALAPLTVLKMLGLTGVDMFFLMSGLGLSHSWHADPSPRRFMKKRLARILPVFWLMVAASLARDAWLGHLRLPDQWRWLGLDFLLHGQLDRWFVPAILLCYGLFLILQTLARHMGLGKALVLAAAVALTLDALLPGGPLAHLLVLTVRVPAFLLGIALGEALRQGPTPADTHEPPHRGPSAWESIRLNGLVLAIGLAAWAVVNGVVPNQLAWRLGLWWYPTVLMAYPLCLLGGRLLGRLPEAGRLRRGLRAMGQVSLELYLVHAFVYSLPAQLALAGHAAMPAWLLTPWRLPQYLLSFALSVGMALWMGPRLAAVSAWWLARWLPGRPQNAAGSTPQAFMSGR